MEPRQPPVLGADRAAAFASLCGPCAGSHVGTGRHPSAPPGTLHSEAHSSPAPASSEFCLKQALFRRFSPQRAEGGPWRVWLHCCTQLRLPGAHVASSGQLSRLERSQLWGGPHSSLFRHHKGTSTAPCPAFRIHSGPLCSHPWKDLRALVHLWWAPSPPIVVLRCSAREGGAPPTPPAWVSHYLGHRRTQMDLSGRLEDVSAQSPGDPVPQELEHRVGQSHLPDPGFRKRGTGLFLTRFIRFRIDSPGTASRACLDGPRCSRRQAPHRERPVPCLSAASSRSSPAPRPGWLGPWGPSLGRRREGANFAGAGRGRGHGFEPWSGKIPHAAKPLGP
ncbi:guanine nucleotide-binding protein subunit beta-like protein 1 isoform X2 [Physeter macrocephalus]|uniref:Guanine nucleotide-binding protein subunit beta-like protein 1 isoform X2 n=1 Tax=Physeter macrocephalus TaxID=9755 RepID=A0A9W2WAZ3_PHYMC|nr:guanine nucleotide-binding protein subunit beta-like protein 1 isoform X2 [Physeter catodon]